MGVLLFFMDGMKSVISIDVVVAESVAPIIMLCMHLIQLENHNLKVYVSIVSGASDSVCTLFTLCLNFILDRGYANILTLYQVVIELGKSLKCSGVTLVASS